MIWGRVCFQLHEYFIARCMLVWSVYAISVIRLSALFYLNCFKFCSITEACKPMLFISQNSLNVSFMYWFTADMQVDKIKMNMNSKQFIVIDWLIDSYSDSIWIILTCISHNALETLEKRALANGGIWVSFPDWNVPHRVKRLPWSKGCLHLSS